MVRCTNQYAFLCFTIGALVFAGCTGTRVASTEIGPDSELDPAGEDVNDPATAARADGTVTVPFNVTFFTLGGIVPDDDRCGAPPLFYNVQDGEGESAHLEVFTVHMAFCVDAADVSNEDAAEDGNPLVEGESIPYYEGVGTFTAANGDELTFTIEGSVLPSDRPEYEFEFADTFEFTGGTGRFQGARGTGVTSSFVDFQARRTDHEWSGTLILQEGN